MSMELTNQKLFGIIIGVGLLSGMLVAGVVLATIPQQSTPTPGKVTFTLVAKLSGFEGVGGTIDGKVNPDLKVSPNDNVTIILKAGEPVPHDWTLDSVGKSETVSTESSLGKSEVKFNFLAGKERVETYYCSIPGHFVTMNGKFIVGTPNQVQPKAASHLSNSVIKSPTDIPAPVGNRSAKNVEFTLVTKEVIAKIDDGTSFTFWTFNGTVPGPLIRVRIGDNVTLHLKNELNSTMVHSIDSHAINLPGGGAAYTQVKPGETKSFTFTPQWEGVFVYHCASPHIPTHISKGMFGALSVEPAAGLPTVAKEFYVGQNEVYTQFPKGTQGHQEFSDAKQLTETPDYVLFNGQVNALTKPGFTLNATVNTTVRIFFAVGGPNVASNFHMIGGVWDRVYYETDWTTPNMINAETIVVPPGSALALEMDITRLGKFILVDHALTRTFDKGSLGFLYSNLP